MITASGRAALLVAVVAMLPVAVVAGEPRIRFGAIDNVKLGTPLAALIPFLEQPIDKTDQQPNGLCFYARPKNDQRFDLMFEADVLTRIDVLKPGPRTAAGVEVGDPVAKVRAAYGKAIRDEPDFYDDRERYLTISSNDGKYAIRFSTSQGKISAIIAGTAKSVEYVEGCL